MHSQDSIHFSRSSWNPDAVVGVFGRMGPQDSISFFAVSRILIATWAWSGAEVVKFDHVSCIVENLHASAGVAFGTHDSACSVRAPSGIGVSFPYLPDFIYRQPIGGFNLPPPQTSKPLCLDNARMPRWVSRSAYKSCQRVNSNRQNEHPHTCYWELSVRYIPFFNMRTYFVPSPFSIGP